MKTVQPDAPAMEIEPPELHTGQLEVLNHPARFKLLRAGRRWRKSGLGVIQAFTGYQGVDREFKGALTGGHIGWWVPSLTSRYIVADWLPIRSIAAQIPGTRIEEANHRVVLPSGGSVMMLTGDNIDSGRGLGLDGAVLDEASLLQELLWTATIRPTLIDRLGWAMLLFTPPIGRPWIFGLAEDVKDDPEWHEFHYRSSDNPTLSASELEKMAETMPSLLVKTELEAEWVSEAGGTFHSDWIQHYFTRFEGEDKVYMLGIENVLESTCQMFHTVDLAWTQEERSDYTVISTWAVTPKKHLILIDVIRGRFQGPDIVPKLRQAYSRYGGVLVVEKATRQMTIIQEAERTGLVLKVVVPDKDKEARAMLAAARMERGMIWFPPASAPWYHEIEQEMLAFPAGMHDDFVDTLAYAVLQVAGRTKYEDRGLITV